MHSEIKYSNVSTPVNESDPFADLEPDIYEEELMKLWFTKISM